MSLKNQIAIRGRFSGCFKTSSNTALDGMDISNVIWQYITVQSISELENFNSKELQVGIYSKLKNFDKVHISEKQSHVVDGLFYELLLRDFKLIKSIKTNGEIECFVEGDYFGLIPDSLPETADTETETSLKDYKEEIITEPKEDVIPHSAYEVARQEGCFRRSSSIEKSSKRTWLTKYRDTSRVGTSNRGCNSLTRIFSFKNIFSFIALFWLGSYLGLSNVVLGLILGTFFILIVTRWLPRLNKVLRSLIGLVFIIFILSTIIGELSNVFVKDWWDDRSKKDFVEEELEWERKRETREETSDELETEGPTYFVHDHNWIQNNGEKRGSQFKANKTYYSDSKQKRNSLSIKANNVNSYWSEVYYSLIQEDENKLEDIVSMYQRIGNQYQLNREQFADMVVTSIQWIPYVLILEKPCEESLYEGGFVTEYLMSGNPCLGEVKFGLQSPVEFMSNFKGDCDTRSVMCFFVLEKFGYDVAVLVSEKYGHSIFGINLNIGGGDYVKYKGKRYYVWETTATGFNPGVIPPDCSNLNYWRVVLTSK